MKLNNLFIAVFILQLSACCQVTHKENVFTGAEQFDNYLSFLQNKKVGLVVNHTSLVGKTHLTDTLISLGIQIQKIYTPEHGLSGNIDAGKYISNDTYKNIDVVSLYGSRKKPTEEELKDVDMMVFDIQDVGVRCYTYVSTLHYIMEACAENHIPLVVLDRPNPNGNYIDGPVLNPEYKSFIGMHPVPVVHGLTLGEFARMINGEKWLAGGEQCHLTVITCKNYAHDTRYNLPVNPSPNLKSMRAVYLYPSVSFFEGTIMSVGRGTMFPFEVVGHPEYPDKHFAFTPQSMTGSANPKFKDQKCYGINFRNIPVDSLFHERKINVASLIEVYNNMGKPKDFFKSSFNYLAGTNQLQQQLKDGFSEEEIRKSWEYDLSKYKEVRKKYLLYPDFN